MNALKRLIILLFIAALAACSSTDPRRIPVPLVEFTPTLSIGVQWHQSIGSAKPGYFSPVLVDDGLLVASANGGLKKLNLETGKPIWQTKVAKNLSAGVGSDGHYIAVAGNHGNVYVLDENGQLIWSTSVIGEIISAPLVGHHLVIVRTVEGQVFAFDANTGVQKWSYQSRTVPLNLRVPLGMTFVGDQGVLIGFSGGILTVINLNNGQPFWQQLVSFASGSTEAERINDITGQPTLTQNMSCVATYQGRIGCFNLQNAQPIWSRPFSSASGVTQNGELLAAVDEWSTLSLFDASNGKLLWENNQAKNRQLTAALITSNWIVTGDYQGYVYFFSKENGELMARQKTDGSAIEAQPIASEETIFVLTRKGSIFAFKPTDKGEES